MSVSNLRREQMDRQVNAVKVEPQDDDAPTLVVSTEADRTVLARINDYKRRAHHALVLLPGLHLIAENVRRACASNPAAAAVAGIAAVAVGAGGVELAVMPARPPAVIREEGRSLASLDPVLRTTPAAALRSWPTARATTGGRRAERPAEEPSPEPSPSPSAEPSPPAPTPEVTPTVNAEDSSGWRPVRPYRRHRRHRHDPPVAPTSPAPVTSVTVERSDSPDAATASPDAATVEPSPAPSADDTPTT
ncbi:hypothetical protein JOL79_11705 [Microbispora sp. RL4-1S]|uniref:Uncharacterized protein n=1 Tax=Microbispora oryzae TaxID=2806554 RepID=A0A940WFA8_9ACTN|nr:hypothetical protein [Microbispora oryzae]MBP2704480.1 hypothetical protein [Microbispora oryzae]